MPDKKQEIYKTEDEIKEEAKLRRKQEEQLSAARKPDSPSKKKLDNYWYHYKWHTIAGIAILLMAVMFLRDMVFRTQPDATIIMISEEYYFTGELEELQQQLEQSAWDRNGDGKVSIQIDFINLPAENDDGTAASQDAYATQMKLVTVVAAGLDPLYLLDESAYNWLMKMGAQGEDEDEAEADSVFIPDVAPADKYGMAGMKFYLRSDLGSGQEYHQYCMELLQALNR